MLDHRLEGDIDIEDLVGTPGLVPAHKVKKEMVDLNAAIRMGAGSDPELTQRIQRLVAEERRTLDRRFGRLAGATGQALDCASSDMSVSIVGDRF